MPDKAPKYRAYGTKDLQRLLEPRDIDRDELLTLRAVASVLPFRVNNYVIENLIDWDNIPHDPIYQLVFPQPGMLPEKDVAKVRHLLESEAPKDQFQAEVNRIRMTLNPHPAGQKQLNIPKLEEGEVAEGIQHKYRETCLFFPRESQICHAFCTYCFRWAQFVGMNDLKIANKDRDILVRYLKEYPEVTDVLFTGGDPMVMKTKRLRSYVEPLLEIDSVRTIRIGTKSVAWWPHRFVDDADADDTLRLFEEIVARGKHLSVMGHYSHPRELSTEVARQAVTNIRNTGAEVRCQAPLIRNVNDSSRVWLDLWQRQLALGAVPYYMFVERDTGAKEYFQVPLARAYRIFTEAYSQISGIGRTVRGPSMSATPGKVLVDGVTEIGGEKVFVLKLLQARDPELVNKVFFAHYDTEAAWLDELRPAFGQNRWPWENRKPGNAERLPLTMKEGPEKLLGSPS